ncbi:calcium-binding protein, partial [Xanthomonas arboricola]|uniref:calcium-binding protein n=1 Tax=Xanthomonas arboricola TaxID=56448 RepID=UPI0017A95C09
GGDGNDTLSGGTGTDRLEGGAGDDVLSVNSQSRDSVFIGGTGNDTLNGSWYSDTYLFNKGDGHDTVVETSSYSGAVDRVMFGEGIAAGDVRVLREGPDVVLDLGNDTDSVRLKDWLSGGNENDSASIEQLVFADGTIWTPATLRAMGLTTLGTDAADTLTGWNGNDLLLGGDGNDTLSGGTGTDRLEGGAGDDVLSVNSQSRDSVFIGGTGNDTLNGSWYSDTYLFNKGDGHDTVVETSTYSGAVDRIVFGEGIAASDVRVLRQGSDVVLDLGNGTDSVRLKDWLSGGNESDSANIEQLVFADGTIWTPATLRAMGLTTLGTDAADTLTGWNGNDLLLGGDGNDTLSGGTGTDRLEGGAGDDVLSVNSQSRDSVLIGGTGNDTLNGSWYSDTYLFNKGDGHDTVVETSTYSGAVDRIVFGEGIAASDVRVLRQGSDVVLDLGNGTDSVRLKDWLSGGNESDSANIEQLVFADGTIWTPATLRAMGLTTLGTDAADTLTGWNGNDLLLGGDGNDTLSGGTGTDRLEGGAGDDVLSVNSQSRDSVLIGGTGNDTLNGSWYSDTYLFNKGDGHDTVVETSTYSGAVDRVSFGSGINLDDTVFTRSGNDLLVTLKGSQDQLAVASWFASDSSQVEYLDFNDRSVAASEVSSLIDAMAVANASSVSFIASRETQETKLMLASSAI